MEDEVRIEELPPELREVLGRHGSALFIFNSDEISHRLPALSAGIGTYGMYVQIEFLRAFRSVSETMGPYYRVSHGDLFESEMSSIGNWLRDKRGDYYVDAALADQSFVAMVRAFQRIDFIPYVLCVVDIWVVSAVKVHKELRNRSTAGYLGLLLFPNMEGSDHVSRALHLVMDKEVGGRTDQSCCKGWQVSDEVLLDLGLKRMKI